MSTLWRVSLLVYSSEDVSLCLPLGECVSWFIFIFFSSALIKGLYSNLYQGWSVSWTALSWAVPYVYFWKALHPALHLGSFVSQHISPHPPLNVSIHWSTLERKRGTPPYTRLQKSFARSTLADFIPHVLHKSRIGKVCLSPASSTKDQSSHGRLSLGLSDVPLFTPQRCCSLQTYRKTLHCLCPLLQLYALPSLGPVSILSRKRSQVHGKHIQSLATDQCFLGHMNPVEDLFTHREECPLSRTSPLGNCMELQVLVHSHKCAGPAHSKKTFRGRFSWLGR